MKEFLTAAAPCLTTMIVIPLAIVALHKLRVKAATSSSSDASDPNLYFDKANMPAKICK